MGLFWPRETKTVFVICFLHRVMGSCLHLLLTRVLLLINSRSYDPVKTRENPIEMDLCSRWRGNSRRSPQSFFIYIFAEKIVSFDRVLIILLNISTMYAFRFGPIFITLVRLVSAVRDWEKHWERGCFSFQIWWRHLAALEWLQPKWRLLMAGTVWKAENITVFTQRNAVEWWKI